jgi:hypothetical protein
MTAAFIVGFWIGAILVGAGVWIGTKPEDHGKLLSKWRKS